MKPTNTRIVVEVRWELVTVVIGMERAVMVELDGSKKSMNRDLASICQNQICV